MCSAVAKAQIGLVATPQPLCYCKAPRPGHDRTMQSWFPAYLKGTAAGPCCHVSIEGDLSST